PVQRRNFLCDRGRGVKEKWGSVKIAVLQVVVDLSVIFIGAGFRYYFNLSSAAVTLCRIIHRCIYAQFLNRLLRRREDALTDGVINGSIGPWKSARNRCLTGIQRIAVFFNLTGRF